MDVMKTIRTDRVVAVIRAPHVADPAGLARTLAEAGIRSVEFTFTIPGVLDAIRAAAESGATIGAGSLITLSQAGSAIDAGAHFLVSPALRPALVKAAGDIPVILGAWTPTEIVLAVEAGAAAVKLFPARVGGPSYVSDLLGPLPDLPLIPSGGIDERSAPEFLRAGALAVYAGSKLASPEAVMTGDHDEIAKRARRFVASLG